MSANKGTLTLTNAPGAKRALHQQRVRFFKIMRRHIEVTDSVMRDSELVVAAINRHLKERGLPLIDPNE